MIKRKCPKCGEVVGSKFCTTCGQDLTGPDVVKICPKCGQENTSNFCTGCGTQLIEKTSGSSNNGSQKVEQSLSHDAVRKSNQESVSDMYKKAKELGAKEINKIGQNIEAKRALKEKKAELEKERQKREMEMLLERQRREAEQLKQQRLREEEERRQQQLKEEEERRQQLREEEERKQQKLREEEERRQRQLREEEERKQQRLREEEERRQRQLKEEEERRQQQLREEEERKQQKLREEEERRQRQLREEEERKQQKLREEEERKHKLEEIKREAQEKAENEKKKKLIEQKKVYEEATTYLDTAEASEDHEISAKFYRKAEELFSSIPGVADADEKILYSARKAKEHEIVLETERIKAEPIDSSGEAEIDVTEEMNTVLPSIEEPSEVPATKSKKKAIIAIIAIAVIVVGGLAFGLTRGESTDTASDSNESIQNQDENADQASGAFPVELVSEDDLKITVTDAYYTQGASDIEFAVTCENNTDSAVDIMLEDVLIDDAKIPGGTDGTDDNIESGEWYISRSVYLDDLSKAGVTDFSHFSCVFTVKAGEKEIEKRELKLKREDFIEADNSISGSEVDNSDKTIEVSKKNLSPIIVSNDRYRITMSGCTYTQGASDLSVDFEAVNNSKELMYITVEDIMIDDSSLQPMFDDSKDPIQAGEVYLSKMVSLDDIKAAGVEDFKEMSLTLVVRVGDKEELRQKIHIIRDGFVEE